MIGNQIFSVGDINKSAGDHGEISKGQDWKSEKRCPDHLLNVIDFCYLLVLQVEDTVEVEKDIR